MKAERKTESAFVPVIVTLESQAEVDGVFALLNHARLLKAVGLPNETAYPFSQFKNVDAWTRLHASITNITTI